MEGWEITTEIYKNKPSPEETQMPMNSERCSSSLIIKKCRYNSVYCFSSDGLN